MIDCVGVSEEDVVEQSKVCSSDSPNGAKGQTQGYGEHDWRAVVAFAYCDDECYDEYMDWLK